MTELERIVEREALEAERRAELERRIRAGEPIASGGGLVSPLTIAGTWETNLTAAARDGTTITSGAANTKGAYSAGQLIAATAADAFGFIIRGQGVATSAAVANLILDLGIGPSGSEVDLVPNIAFSSAPGTGSQMYYFPLYIAAGERIAARAAANTLNDTVIVGLWLLQKPIYAPQLPARATAYGVDTANSRGTSVTPASGAFGAWTQIAAATSRDHDHWISAWTNLADTTLTGEAYLWEIGFGPDSANVQKIGGPWIAQSNATEETQQPIPPFPIYAPVPSGQALFARASAGSVEARGIIIYGMD